MMRSKLLISVANAVLILAETRVPLTLHGEEGDFLDGFEKSSRIDTSNVPYFNSTYSETKPCSNIKTFSWPLGGRNHCSKIRYWVEEEFIPGTDNIMATPEVNVEADVWANSSSVFFNTSQATAILDNYAEGWGLEVRPMGHSLGSLFTRGRQQPKAQVQRKTVQHTAEHVCPAWHHCQVQVLSWHAIVLGQCKRVAKLACTEEMRICDQKREHLQCSEYQKYYDENCHGTIARDCGFKVPLLRKNGTPMGEMKLITRDRRPYFTGCFRGYPWAMLSNGEIYDPVEDLYFVHMLRPTQWFAKDSSEPPPLMPKKFPCSPQRQLPESGSQSLLECTDAACLQFKDESLVRELVGGDWEQGHAM
ncbi:hypothetical protein CP533_0035 [Ophiocordyceps camponoti-saundersi (nom. inval.)]|nr:hypothetical protein CP533_0035 [Ophiocordyceps camponoti-saundersi (nom. inval.)]